MGMFDYIDYKCDCPYCDHTVTGFQSKDGPCIMITLLPSNINTMYTSCRQCGKWVEFEVIKKEVQCPHCLKLSDDDSMSPTLEFKLVPR